MFKKSIRNKLIGLLLITTIIPFGTSIIITYFHTKDYLEKQVVQENSNLLYQGRVNLENYINELNGLTLSLYNNPDFINYLRSSSNTDNYLTIGIIKNVMQTILYAEDNINAVHITLTRDNRVVSASKRSTVVFSNQMNGAEKEPFLKAKESPFNMYIESMNVKQPITKTGINEISIHRSFTNIPSDEVLAYISLELSPENILEISKNLYNDDSEEFYLLAPDGTLIYSSNNDVSVNEDKQKWINKVIHSNQEKGTMEWKEASFNGVMIYDQIPESAGGWFLVKRVPYVTLYESAFNVAKINIMFGIIGLLLVILATMFVSFKITSPIRILSQNIQQVEEGKMEVQFESLGKDEIGILGYRFKQMVEKVNHLINREYRLELENKTNQLKVLQSQINPHFLYNALQSIGTVALKNNVPQIYTLITHLSKIMRYGMNMEEDIVPLIKEINYTKAFLLLQKERFGDHLHYSITVDEDAANVNIPKMILQPIIENYFKHGFDIRDGVGSIKVECVKVGEFLLINVIDNGVGVSEKRFEEIYQHFEEGSRNESGEVSNIGLKNVYVRLKLYYGELATLQLKNVNEGGFLVSIMLPISVEGGQK
ncbi:sensor histidine kinase [Cytobacillus sp. S13-E01]|uniref:sensor histidine kinase n=1 Tax=Cytobacillus sp. S13-E01 TaxID=3031326 RepID=UPI0023D82B29|nr:sensor histidine kinase [Cytobacillus sp. S13-E01]MDF0727271.1 sensor histidine kinase [Cytobacillus sp. S13-E01]